MSKWFYRVCIKRALELETGHRRDLGQRVKDFAGDDIFEKSWKTKDWAEREARLIERHTGVPMEVGEYMKAMKVL